MLLSSTVTGGLLRWSGVLHRRWASSRASKLKSKVLSILNLGQHAGTCWAATNSACEEQEHSACLGDSACSWCSSAAVGDSCYTQAGAPGLLCWPLICLTAMLRIATGITMTLDSLKRAHGGHSSHSLMLCLPTYRRMPTGYLQPSSHVLMVTTVEQSLSPDLQLAPVAPPEAQVKHQQLVQHGPGLIKVRLRSLADA